MRNLILCFALTACEFDLRPECPLEIEVVDGTTGTVELRPSTRFACRDTATRPDRIMYEAIIDDGEPVTEHDLDALCDEGNWILALEVEALADTRFEPWSDKPSGSVVFDEPQHAVDGAWFLVSFMETQPGAGSVSVDPWSTFFQLGSDGVVEPRRSCYER